MRLLILLAILLAFPALELVLMIWLAERFGWWLLVYLIFAAVCGWLLIQDERWVAFGRMAATLGEGQHPVRALLASARKVVAGILLILPGVLGDVLAIVILLIPMPRVQPARDDSRVIEGEWRREE
ncbi:phage T7 F exclusion suppressor FxsA [mine drainage metagenome]|uniref:Phage T7 F exclusion suppressor FxsA n=1 Tax=mine drainage metagenome TaxID=410659 RepID=A0A1J5R7I3_9ZZZZ